MSETIKFSELEGKGVLSQDGREIGEVADLVLSPSTWTVDTIVVKLERDLLERFHMKRPLFGTQTVQLPTTYVSGVGDKVILHKTLSDLTALVRDASEIKVDVPAETEEEGAETAEEESPAKPSS